MGSHRVKPRRKGEDNGKGVRRGGEKKKEV